jgi:hypothetical protein
MMQIKMIYKIKSKKVKEKKIKLQANYFEVHISQTAKPIGSKKSYEIYNQETKTFKNEEELNKFLEENYKNRKKQKMFIDDKEGNHYHIGYIYGFKTEAYDRDKGKNIHYFQKDWVEIRKVNAVPYIK